MRKKLTRAESGMALGPRPGRRTVHLPRTPEAKRAGFRIAIEGIEATQATQFYRSGRHLDPATAEPDNAVPLVAGKPLALRVYPDLERTRPGTGFLSVEGELTFQRPGTRRPARRPFPLNRRVFGQPAAAIDRGSADQTLNFLIPGEEARGRLLVRARVWAGLPGGGRRASRWFERTLEFIETRPLRLRLHGVRYRRDRLDLPAPSAVEALETLAFLRKTYPVATVEPVSYDTLEFGGDLADSSGGGCGSGWNLLLLLLHRLRMSSQSSDLHCAFLPAGVPCGSVGGSGSALGIAAARAGDGSTFAQEVGHALRRRHAPGAGATDVDPAYPAYGDHRPGTIGEHGFDPARGQVFSPIHFQDFMGYRPGFWVSPHTYRGLLSLFLEKRKRDREASRAGAASRDRRRLYLCFTLDRDHRLRLQGGLTLRGPPLEAWYGKSPFRLELRDGRGSLLCARSVRLPAGEPGESPLPLFESILSHPRAHQLVFHCCRRHPPQAFEIPRGSLRLRIVSPLPVKPGGERQGTVDLRWEVSSEREDRPAIYLRYSPDGGRSWHPVSAEPEGPRSRVDLDRLPGGDDCRLQVIASTVLETAVAETPPFRVRRKPRVAMIAGGSAPRTHRGPLLELIGTAYSPDGFAAEEDLVWNSDLQGRLGQGSHLLTPGLVAGAHRITLSAPDGLGGETRAETVIRVLPEEP